MEDMRDKAINLVLGIHSLSTRMLDIEIVEDAMKKLEGRPQPLLMALSEMQFGAMAMLFKLKDCLYALHRAGEIEDENFNKYLDELKKIEDKMHPKQEEKE